MTLINWIGMAATAACAFWIFEANRLGRERQVYLAFALMLIAALIAGGEG